ncbi:hypothetical protein TEA_012216 [Camellia sinensis var. sinensis]|uniref:non-specific serine/threonine protein kinase n=1 Tax=Camellia sinensis var. sinensis TaxID=542762 RepID=A0A4S4E1K8_CAMSN|nr:hypothetical protein TEA_012216 [Camellia sinensis var. sinensis]
MTATLYFLILLYLYLKLMALAEDENQFTYNGFHGANLHLDGVAQVHPNGLLQLTNTSKHQAGHAFYQTPIKFNTSSSSGYGSLSFSTNFIFVMVPEITNFSGHGIAFTISPSMDFTQAVVSQYLGLFNSSNNGLTSNHLLAIEFDTIKNLEFSDINDNHVGIDVNGLNSTVSAPVTYYSNSKGINKSLDLISGNPMQVWIDYDEVANLLNVAIAPIKNQKPNRPLLSIHINLSLILLDYMYVGFSSATGSVASNNYILGWSFHKSGQAQSLELAKLPSFPKQRNRKEKSNLEITVSLVTVSIVLIITILGIVYFVRRKKYEEIHEVWEKEYGPQRFSYKDLYRATKGFKDTELIGAGGFGKVYRGVLPSSKQLVAVKKVSHDSKQGMKEFVAEIASMGRLRHMNLVQLLGYCRRRGEMLLVYDYMPNGSLDKFLFSNKKRYLNWAQRSEDENQFIYNGFHGANLYLDGVAQIHPNGLLQLTNSSKQEIGHAFYRLPIIFNASSSGLPQTLSFSANFIFSMVPIIPNLSGHGIAFTISPSLNFSQAEVAQYLGLLNLSNNGLTSNHLLAVELDTIRSPEFDDGKCLVTQILWLKSGSNGQNDVVLAIFMLFCTQNNVVLAI